MSLELQKLPIWLIMFPILGLIALGWRFSDTLLVSQQAETDAPPATETSPSPEINQVTALGRLEPQGEVTQVSSSQQGATVQELLVEPGDRVEVGELIAKVDNFDSRKAAVETARKELAVARSRLEQVKAGAQQGEIEAQQARIERLKQELAGEQSTQAATIERLEAQLRNAQTEYQRHQFLAEQGAIAESELDQRRLELENARQQYQEAVNRRNQTIETLEQQIREAEATLDQIEEIRPEDIQQAQAEVDHAMASLQQAQADLKLSKITSPQQGQVLDINTHPGEMVNETNGIIDIGNTQQMMAIAEVYESDISQVKLGQSVTIRSESGAFSEQLEGEVTHVGLQIGIQEIFATDPAESVNSRVVEVEVMLTPEDSQLVQGLTHSQVILEINVDDH